MKLDELQIKKKLSLAFENYKNRKFQTAEKLYKEILALNKNHLEANFNLGSLYSQLRKFDLALPLLMKAKELNPNNININLVIEVKFCLKSSTNPMIPSRNDKTIILSSPDKKLLILN